VKSEEAHGRIAGRKVPVRVHYAVAGRIRLRRNALFELTGGRRGRLQAVAGIARDRRASAEGEDKIMIFGDADNTSALPHRCGSLLYSVVRAGGFVHVAMGTLVDNQAIRPTAHILSVPRRRS